LNNVSVTNDPQRTTPLRAKDEFQDVGTIRRQVVWAVPNDRLPKSYCFKSVLNN